MNKVYIDNYDELFMNMVYLVAMKSKDRSSHLGAVVVGPDNEVRSVGFNSFPRGIDDNVPERQERPEKYNWFAHAERNAVYNAARTGASLKGCRLYTNGVPCLDCAIGVIQAGIEEVIVDETWGVSSAHWDEKCAKAYDMLKEAGVKIRTIKFDTVTIVKYQSGNVID